MATAEKNTMLSLHSLSELQYFNKNIFTPFYNASCSYILQWTDMKNYICIELSFGSSDFEVKRNQKQRQSFMDAKSILGTHFVSMGAIL